MSLCLLKSIVPIPLVIFILHSYAILTYAQSIKTGDRVVAISRAPVQVGTEIMTRVKRWEVLTVKEVQGDWCSVTVHRREELFDGWIQTKYLIRARSDLDWKSTHK